MTESEKLIRNEAEAIECLKSNKPTSGYMMLQESIDMAIQALEKQIPMKPMMVYDDKVDSNWCSCPICANGIGWEIPARKIKFCWECGKKLDWSESDGNG